jgi:hypothetical protein
MRSRRFLALALIFSLLLGCTQTPQQPTAAPAAQVTTQPPTLAPIPTGPLLAPSQAPSPAIELRASPTAVPPTSSVPTQAPPATAVPAVSPAALGPLERTLSHQTPPLQGDDVRIIQQLLIGLGYRQVGDADGIYGPQTEAAVRSFQALNALEADGVVGPQTWRQLGDANATPAWAAVPIVETMLCEKHLLVGASHGDQWFDNLTAGQLVRGDETYRFFTNAGPQGSATSTKVAVDTTTGVPYGDQFQVALAPEPGRSGSIGIAGDWDVQPRRPITVTQEADLRVYKAIVADFLRSEGIRQPSVDDAQTFVVWRIDLDGDGAQETLINASRFITSQDSSAVQAGAYSVMLLQRASGSINGIYNNLFPQESQAFDHVEHTLFAALDLNGDGQLEIVLKSSYFESAELRIFGLRASEIRQLLYVGCGV